MLKKTIIQWYKIRNYLDQSEQGLHIQNNVHRFNFGCEMLSYLASGVRVCNNSELFCELNVLQECNVDKYWKIPNMIKQKYSSKQ